METHTARVRCLAPRHSPPPLPHSARSAEWPQQNESRKIQMGPCLSEGDPVEGHSVGL